MAFTPTDYTGLVFWLDAAALALANGDPVASWTDASGNGRHAVQATGAAQPTYRTNQINGLPAVDFDGTGDGLQVPAVDLAAWDGITVYAVARFDTLATDQVLIESSANYNSNVGGVIAYYDLTQTGFVAGRSVTSAVGSWECWSPITAATPCVLTARASFVPQRAGVAGFVNGAGVGAYVTDPKAPSTPTRFTLGNHAWNIGARNNAASLRFDGQMGEVLVYRRLHSPLERMTVEAYLAETWGIALTPATVAAVYDGHSYTEGDSAGTVPVRRWWHRGMQLVTEGFDWIMPAKSGTTLEKFADDKVPADRWLENALPKRILASQCGTNDLVHGYSDARTELHYQDDWARMLASNATHRSTRTIMDRQDLVKPGTWDASQITLNAYVAANAPAGVTILDVAAIPKLGDDLAANDTTWFSTDKIHPTEHPGETRLGIQWTDYLVDEAGLTRWDPSLLSGCVLWLKADALTGLPDGDPVGTWSDSSGSGHHATAPASGQRPLYKTNVLGTPGALDLPVVRFDGTDDVLATAAIDLSATAAVTVFAVASSDANLTEQVIVESSTNWSANVGAFTLHKANTTGRSTAGARGNVGSTSSVASLALATVAKVHAAWLDFAQATAALETILRTNGVRTAGTGSNNTGAFGNFAVSVGARGNNTARLAGDIAELLVFSRRLTLEEFRRCEAYLAHKWGIY